ncbi:MAG: RNA ligase family protein [Dehalococcoidia bacterium]|nr:RNA ligase family protein [Dehalococcoidia bacterium]
MEKIKPMLAKDGGEVTNDPRMLFELKYDGARAIAFVDGTMKGYRLQARSGTDKTATFPELEFNLTKPAILDGEIVSAAGKSFQDGIQPRVNRDREILMAVKAMPAKLVVFDVLEVDGNSVENLPLLDRKELLAQILIPTPTVEMAPYFDDGVALLAQSKALKAIADGVYRQGEEGIVGKHKHGRYLRDKREWLKVKCWQLGTFMAIGYTAGTGWRASTFGALVLADAKGNYVGEVGTGFNAQDISDLMKMFSLSVCPFPREPEPATWIKPFAVKVRYLEMTNDGVLRFPSFKGVV